MLVKILSYFVFYLLEAVMIAMFLRAVLSWFPLRDDNPFMGFLTMVTEPFILPLRNLFYKMNWFQQTPLDVAYVGTVLTIVLLTSLLRMLF